MIKMENLMLHVLFPPWLEKKGKEEEERESGKKRIEQRGKERRKKERVLLADSIFFSLSTDFFPPLSFILSSSP